MSISRSRSLYTDGQLRVFLGFDADEMIACAVARRSIEQHTPHATIHRVSRLSLGDAYTRPTTRQGPHGALWDVISEAPMSTDHAIARFFVPWLCDFHGWALFMDGDILCRQNLADLEAFIDERYAVMCVQHPALLAEGTKKDGAIQQHYRRKNWSSVLLFNCGHEANRILSPDEILNTVPGRNLHGFNWLDDNEIGALPPEWNHLVNVNPHTNDAAIAHFTLGTPLQAAHAYDPYSDEWYAVAALAGYRLTRPARPALEQAG